MDVHEAIRTRYTADAFGDKAPPRELVERLIQTAVWAPNHHLTEPWRFFVVGGNEREKMGAAIAEWLQSAANPETPDEDDVARARRSMLRSPVTVVVAQSVEPGTSPVRDLEDYAACCCATHNLLLAAHADGLAAKWATGRMSRYRGAKDYLGLAERDRIVAYVMLSYGVSAAEEPARERTPPAIAWLGL